MLIQPHRPLMKRLHGSSREVPHPFCQVDSLSDMTLSPVNFCITVVGRVLAKPLPQIIQVKTTAGLKFKGICFYAFKAETRFLFFPRICPLTVAFPTAFTPPGVISGGRCCKNEQPDVSFLTGTAKLISSQTAAQRERLALICTLCTWALKKGKRKKSDHFYLSLKAAMPEMLVHASVSDMMHFAALFLDDLHSGSHLAKISLLVSLSSCHTLLKADVVISNMVPFAFATGKQPSCQGGQWKIFPFVENHTWGAKPLTNAMLKDKNICV